MSRHTENPLLNYKVVYAIINEVAGCSAGGAHLVRDQGVGGSNPLTPIFFADFLHNLTKNK